MSHPDPWRSAPLGNGYAASVCVTPTGGTVLWLLGNGGQLDDSDDYGCTCIDCAPHEHPDRPLPTRMLNILDRPTHPRCGRRRSDGHPCRALVTHPGNACHWHRTETTP